MHSERDKFLYEQMGLKATYLLGDYRTQLDQKARTMNGFSNWLEFGLLWEWCVKQKWWSSLVTKNHSVYVPDSIPVMYVNPDKFADIIYEFLKRKINET